MGGQSVKVDRRLRLNLVESISGSLRNAMLVADRDRLHDIHAAPVARRPISTEFRVDKDTAAVVGGLVDLAHRVCSRYPPICQRQPVGQAVRASGFRPHGRDGLRKIGLDPRALVLEITESTLVEPADHVREMLGYLRSFGVRLAVDDFGTGYSSLSYLGRLPVSIVKLDRSFISELSGGSGKQKISADEKLVSGTIDLSHGQNLTVVAEGVENSYQADLPKKMGCDMVQGYGFSEPLTGDTVPTLLEGKLRRSPTQ